MNKAGSGLPRGIQRRGDKLIAYLTHPGGRRERRSLGNVSVSVAVKMLHRWQTEIADATYTPKKRVQADAVTFEEIADDWLEMQKSEHLNSLESTESRLKLIRDWFGSKKAQDITTNEIKAKLKDTAAERQWAKATYNNYRLALSGIYRLAIKNEKFSANPAAKVELKKNLNNARDAFLSDEQANTLRAVIAKYYPARLPDYDLGLSTGMRHSEQYGKAGKRIKTPGLTWDKVNLAASLVTIPESKHGEKRYVSLNETAKAALRVLKSRRKTSDRVMVDPSGKNYLGVEMKWFEKSLALAGIPSGVDAITWHSLRHTFASWLVMAGVDLRTVQVLMGHKNIKTTMRYAHLAPDHLTNAVNRLDKPVSVTVPTPKHSTATKTATVLPVTPQAYTN